MGLGIKWGAEPGANVALGWQGRQLGCPSNILVVAVTFQMFLEQLSCWKCWGLYKGEGIPLAVAASMIDRVYSLI